MVVGIIVKSLRRGIFNAGVVVASLVAGVFVCEAVARIVLNPADYLSATTVADETLGIRLVAGTRGTDEWGFRNVKVPPTVDIVAIGDSHTYGNNATMAESWPYVAGRLTGRSAYNLGLGGYGPNQYYYLLRTYALRLKPRWVLCGVYMGDDFENAFGMTYGTKYWSFLRTREWNGVNAAIWEATDDTVWQQSARVWLSRNSLVYQMAVHGPLLGALKGYVQVTGLAADERASTTSLILREPRIREAFRPVGIRDRLDQNSVAVREGMRITFELLKAMDQVCREHGCRFAVVMIPTKETVFADYLLREPGIHLRDVISDLVRNEAEARRRLVEFLDDSGVPVVDTLPALRRRVGDRLYTPGTRDMHPNGNGYRVIGEAVAEFLERAGAAQVGEYKPRRQAALSGVDSRGGGILR
jgi:hypothetical protein